MSLLLSGVMAGSVNMENLQDTGYIQEQYVVENYFHWVDEQAPIVYRSGRVLGQPTTESKLTNRSDCGGILVGYMMYLDLIVSRWKDANGKSFTSDGGGLNSYRLWELGDQKPRREVKRGDFIYMEFPSGNRHVAVACDDGANTMFDLYKDDEAKCREVPPTSLIKFSSNGFVKFMEDRGIVLDETKQVLDYFQQIKNEATQTGTGQNATGIESDGNNANGSTFVSVIRSIVAGVLNAI